MLRPLNSNHPNVIRERVNCNQRRSDIIRRLNQIQVKLNKISPKDEETVLLYKEAAILFQKIGKIDNSLSCVNMVRKTEKFWTLPVKVNKSITNLPVEILTFITKEFNMITKIKLSVTCKALMEKMADPIFWRVFDMCHLTKDLTNKDFAILWKKNKGSCQSLILANCKLLTNSFASESLAYLPRALVNLSITGNSKINRNLLTFLSRPSLKNTLKSINLSSCRIDDYTVSRILYFLNIESLDISNCVLITNAAFVFKIVRYKD
jgi:hypothetical protein